MGYPRRGLARLFALLVTWIVVVFYVAFGFLRRLSLFTIAWRVLFLALVVYMFVFYYALWVVSQGAKGEEGNVSHDESGENQ
ncbi:MAG: hypothetical protein N2Z84_01365 [Atribacterota bacterium]|nr:hypothetical protein [Atribacterota bacterium]